MNSRAVLVPFVLLSIVLAGEHPLDHVLGHGHIRAGVRSATVHILCGHDGEVVSENANTIIVEVVDERTPILPQRMRLDALAISRAYEPPAIALVVTAEVDGRAIADGLSRLCPTSGDRLGLDLTSGGTFAFVHGEGLVFDAPGVFLRVTDKHSFLAARGHQFVSSGFDPHRAFVVGEEFPDVALVDAFTLEAVNLRTLRDRVLVYVPTACAACAARQYRSDIALIVERAASAHLGVAVLYSTPADEEATAILHFEGLEQFVIADAVGWVRGRDERSPAEEGPTVLLLEQGAIRAVMPLDDASASGAAFLGKAQ